MANLLYYRIYGGASIEGLHFANINLFMPNPPFSFGTIILRGELDNGSVEL
jgi:hypothetical protein